MLGGATGRVLLGQPARRIQRRNKADIERLRNQRRVQSVGSQASISDLDRLWQELKDPAGAVSMINIDRLPADALAFYKPFHFSPHQEWGIYMLAGRLLNYCIKLYSAFRAHLAAFTLETLLGCVLFEVFHHEFFHHLVECAATTMEFASAGWSEPRAIYADYLQARYAQEPGLGPHRDHPLEEALANAYAYNSFSFLSRTQIGHKLVWVKLYQKVLEKCWPHEPAGYRSAGEYVNGGYVSGAAQLLAMLLSSRHVDPASLLLLAKCVMPNGNSAFLQKAEVPTYFVGSESELAQLLKLAPVPIETYTTLFWLGDTSEVDFYLKARKQEELRKRHPHPPLAQ